jgi:hypothetical protein
MPHQRTIKFLTAPNSRIFGFVGATLAVALFNAVGVAILKVLGSNPAIMNRNFFNQEQIARAADLGIRAS